MTAAMTHDYLRLAWSEDPLTCYKHYSMALTNTKANLPGHARSIMALVCVAGIMEEANVRETV
jgi:hypothetical protein